MKNRIYIFICSFMTVFSFSANAQHQTDKKLENKLRVLLSSFHGTAGVYVRNLKTGKEATINADTIFPTASIVKVPILVGVFKKIDEGLYTYHQPLVYRDSIARGGSGLMQFFKDSTPTELRTLVSLMLSHSDNTAAVWCEKLAGGGVEINSWLEKNGFKNTRVNARTAGRETMYKEYGWGQTTPREMSDLMVMIREGKTITEAASEQMYRDLTDVFWDEYAVTNSPLCAGCFKTRYGRCFALGSGFGERSAR